MSNNNNSERKHEWGEGANVPDGVERTLDAEASESILATWVNYTFMLIVVVAVTLSALAYIKENSSGFRVDIFNRGVPATAKVERQKEKLFDVGKRLYASTCLVCHQATGLGIPPAFPPLAKSEWALGPKEVPINVVLYGLMGQVKVKGSAFNGAMIPFGATLDDKKIAAILTYVRGQKEWGNKSTEISPEEVKAIREKNKGRGLWTEAELLMIHPIKRP